MRSSALFLVAAAAFLTACKPSESPSSADPAPAEATAPGGMQADSIVARAPAAATPASTPASTPPETTGRPAASASNLAALTPVARQGEPIRRPDMVRLPSGLEYAILKAGSGSPPPMGATVKVHHTGWLQQSDRLGQEFLSSRDDGTPHEFTLEEGKLIPSWLEALSAMKPGERRWLVVPSSLAYGQRGFPGVVPSNKDLVFDLELVEYTK